MSSVIELDLVGVLQIYFTEWLKMRRFNLKALFHLINPSDLDPNLYILSI